MMYWLMFTPWLYVLLPRDTPCTLASLLPSLVTRFLGVDVDVPSSAPQVLDSIHDTHTWHAFTNTDHSVAEGDVPLFMLGVYTAAASVTMALSALYHTFMPTARKQWQYDLLLKIDVAGVWLVNVAGWALSVFTIGACVAPLHVRLLPLLLVGAGTLFMIIRAETALQRGVPLLLIAAPRMLGFPLRLWLGLGSADATGLWALSEVVAVVGGAVNVARIPERWAPGRHDYFNSHTIMHVLALVAIATAHLAAARDRAWIMQDDHHVRVCLAEESSQWLQPTKQVVHSVLGALL